MTSAQVVETSVTNNSPFQNYSLPDDHTIQTITNHTAKNQTFVIQTSFLSYLINNYLFEFVMSSLGLFTYLKNLNISGMKIDI